MRTSQYVPSLSSSPSAESGRDGGGCSCGVADGSNWVESWLGGAEGPAGVPASSEYTILPNLNTFVSGRFTSRSCVLEAGSGRGGGSAAFLAAVKGPCVRTGSGDTPAELSMVLSGLGDSSWETERAAISRSRSRSRAYNSACVFRIRSMASSFSDFFKNS